MDWTMADRPRRLVTYGKLANKRSERKLRAPPTPVPDDKNGDCLTSKSSKVISPTRSEKYSTLEESLLPGKDHGFGPLGEPTRTSNRSPKRRKLSPEAHDPIPPTDDSRPRTRRGDATQFTHSLNDTLRRSASDTLGATQRLNTKTSPSSNLSIDRTERSKNNSPPFHHTDATSHTIVTPSRRRLVDSLRSLDDQMDSSDSDLNSPQQVSEVAGTRELSPLPGDGKTSQSQASQLKPKLYNNKSHEVVDVSASSQSISPKITYSRQRSFLRSIDIHDGSTGDAKADLLTNLYSLPAQSSSIDNTEAEQPENSRTVRSIHELRRAGGNARFQGLVDSIFEDIEDRSSSASVRRSGFIQLCEKLCEEKFAQQFVEIGAFDRLVKSIPTRGDFITIILSVYACALVLRLGHLPNALYAGVWSKLIASAPILLSLDDSTLKLVTQRRSALSKINQASIRDICLDFGRLLQLDDNESQRMSPRRLVLRSLHLTVRKVREKDLTETIPVEVISQIVGIFLEIAQKMSDDGICSDDFVIFESIIAILETYTTSSNITGQAQQDVLMPLAESSHLLISLSDQNDAQDIQSLTLHLRLILNITNADPRLCENFATRELIHGLTNIILSNYSTASDELIDDKKDSLDIVILALGALINLTEVSEAARQNIVTQKYDSESLLKQLISIFTQGFETVSEADSVVQTHSNVAFGYLSILLCTLCIEREAYAVVKGTMNGVGLEKLLATVEEFLHYHRKVDEELHQSQSVKEFTSRLQRILNQIRAIGGK